MRHGPKFSAFTPGSASMEAPSGVRQGTLDPQEYWSLALDRLPWMARVEPRFYSGRMGLVKPDREIFLAVLEGARGRARRGDVRRRPAGERRGGRSGGSGRGALPRPVRPGATGRLTLVG
ncbi:hypothetical protein GCM10010404_52670 [Nonomuraea africana]